MTTILLLAAALRLATPFTDHAVLQRDKPVLVRGEAEPGAEVTVAFAGQRVTGTAGADGAWRVTLAPMPASKEGRALTVASQTSQAVLRDVVVGEVWLASGQSNMEMPLVGPNKRFRPKNGLLVSQWSSNANYRICLSPWKWKIADAAVRTNRDIRWEIPNYEYLATNRISALAYFFGRELVSTLDVPVGVMVATVGGTPANAWVPDSGWESVRDEPFVATNCLAEIAHRKADGKPRSWPAYPGDLWNELVAPLAPYTARGMIWYQGESDITPNAKGLIPYSKNMRALLDGWRREFASPDLKFLFVELAPFSYFWHHPEPDDDTLARLCDEQQRFAASEPDAYLACISDVGDANDIHPARKLEVAYRLAGLAFQHVYALPVKADAPRAVAARLVAPGRVEIELEHGEGLFRWMQEVSIWTARQKETSPIRFIDAKGRIVACESVIENGKIVAASLEMAEPKYVTHLRRPADESNIYNGSGLPLGTFRLEIKKQ